MLEGEGAAPGDDSGGDRQHRDVGKTLIVRPATRADLDRFQTFRPTCEAIAAELDGKVIAIGGFVHVQGRVYAFLDLTPEVRRFKLAIHKAGRALIERARRRGFRFVYAQIDDDEPTAERWLTRLGFEPVGDIDGSRLYRWQN